MSLGPRFAAAAVLLAAPAMLAACGSAAPADLPPAAGPPREVAPLSGGRTAVLLGRERILELRDARGRLLGSAPAGVGPTGVACLDRGAPTSWCYVTDTRGNALLVFAVGAGVQPRRRLYLPGGPTGVSVDHARRRLFVTVRAGHELVELPAHGRPHVLRTRPLTRRTALR